VRRYPESRDSPPVRRLGEHTEPSGDARTQRTRASVRPNRAQPAPWRAARGSGVDIEVPTRCGAAEIVDSSFGDGLADVGAHDALLAVAGCCRFDRPARGKSSLYVRHAALL
jgi:hypothetical protein